METLGARDGRGDLLGGKAVLDFGALTGRFCAAAEFRADRVVGVEPDDAMRQYARRLGLNVRESLDELAGERFDLITLFHVFEHMPDPAEGLARLAKHLKPGGTIVIETPNIDDALISRYRIDAYIRFHRHPARNFFWAPSTLTRLCESHGWRATILPVQRHGLSNHLEWMLEGRPGGHERSGGVISQGADESYRADLKRAMVCDILWAELLRS